MGLTSKFASRLDLDCKPLQEVVLARDMQLVGTGVVTHIGSTTVLSEIGSVSRRLQPLAVPLGGFAVFESSF